MILILFSGNCYLPYHISFIRFFFGRKGFNFCNYLSFCLFFSRDVELPEMMYLEPVARAKTGE